MAEDIVLMPVLHTRHGFELWTHLHEARACANHSQSLARLRERGGLDAVEMLAVVLDVPTRRVMQAEPTEAEALAFLIDMRRYKGVL